MLIELKPLSLFAQLFGGLTALVPNGWVLLLWPYRAATYCRALIFVVALAVTSCSTYSVGNDPSSLGNSPPVLTAWKASGCVRSAAMKKCALSCETGPPNDPPNWFLR